MAKKKKEENERPRSRTRVVDVIAFFGLAASAILLLIGPILRKFITSAGGGAAVQALTMIAQYCLLAAVAIPAWYFVRNKGVGFKVFYAVCLVLYIAGTILGVTLGI